MLLTADLLLNYQRCKRRAFLQVYGDRSLQDLPNDYLLKILEDSALHRSEILADYSSHQPTSVKQDWRVRVEQTLDLMSQGVESIQQGVLATPLEAVFEGIFAETALNIPGEVWLVSQPDLLIKSSGQSTWGNWSYQALDVKFGKRHKLEYQLIGAFHALILAQMQQQMPHTSWLVLRPHKSYAVTLSRVMAQLQTLIEECLQLITAGKEPEVFISRHRCELCHWLSSCRQVAKSTQHLSLIAGVTPTRYQALQAAGVNTVEDLANLDPEALEPLMDREISTHLVYQAQAAIAQSAIILAHPHPQDLPIAPIELYFDIEAEPDLELEYLLGVLVVDRINQTREFQPFLAESPEHETENWQQFWAFLQRYPQAPIFHFCDYEFKTIQQLGKRYRVPKSQVDAVLSRFVDLHERVTRLVALPVEGYALKAIARWIGFEWRDSKANGAQCIYWYDQWLKTGDRTFLEAIVRYNEDDCQATYQVKEWLCQICMQLH